MKINKGDVVGRISYNKDILFVVDRIIKNINGQDIAIIKGVSKRIVADSPIKDLEKIDTKIIRKIENELDNKINTCINHFLTNLRSANRKIFNRFYFTFRRR